MNWKTERNAYDIDIQNNTATSMFEANATELLKNLLLI